MATVVTATLPGLYWGTFLVCGSLNYYLKQKKRKTQSLISQTLFDFSAYE